MRSPFAGSLGSPSAVKFERQFKRGRESDVNGAMAARTEKCENGPFAGAFTDRPNSVHPPVANDNH
jgi:hypothetical protein